MSGTTVLRELKEEDLDGVAALAARAHVPVARDNLARALTQWPEGCFVLEHEGALAGAVTSAAYLEVGVLGDVILDPRYQGGGFDLLLVRRALMSLSNRPVLTVEVEAPPRLVALFAALGFTHMHDTVVLEGSTLAAAARSANVRPATEFDLLDVGALDTETFGYGRKGLLNDLMEATPQGALVAHEDGDLAGYLFTSRVGNEWRLGPWVLAKGCEEYAAPLLDTALTRLPAGTVLLHVPTHATEALAILKERGFEERARRTRMRWGAPRPALPNARGEYASPAT